MYRLKAIYIDTFIGNNLMSYYCTCFNVQYIWSGINGEIQLAATTNDFIECFDVIIIALMSMH